MNQSKNSAVWVFYRRWRLVLNCALLTVLFFADCWWGGMVYIVYPLLLAMVCFDDFANATSYLVYVIPFVALNGWWGGLFYLLCFLAVVFRFYLTLWGVERQRPQPLLLIFIGLFVTYCLLPIGPYNGDLWRKIALFLVVFVMVSIIAGKPEVLRLSVNVRTLAVAIIVASLLGCLRPVIPHLKAIIPSYIGNGWPRFTALFWQPNALGMLCSVIVSLFAYLLISRRAQWYDYLLMFSITAIGFAALSKTCLVIMVLVYLIILGYLLHRNWAPTVVVSLVVLMVVIGFCCLKPTLVSDYLGRFTENLAGGEDFTAFMNNLTTLRYALWVNYSTYLWQHPLALFFGRGLGAAPLFTPTNGRYLSPHNFLLAMVYQLGLVGTALFVAVLVLMFRQLKKRRTTAIHRAIWVPILILLLLLSVEDTILYITEIKI